MVVQPLDLFPLITHVYFVFLNSLITKQNVDVGPASRWVHFLSNFLPPDPLWLASPNWDRLEEQKTFSFSLFRFSLGPIWICVSIGLKTKLSHVWEITITQKISRLCPKRIHVTTKASVQFWLENHPHSSRPTFSSKNKHQLLFSLLETM